MEPHVINKNFIAGTPYLNLVSLSYINKKGKHSTWISAERPNNQNAVVIVAINPESDPYFPLLIVTREYRVPIQGYEWGLPAGLIDPGQTIEKTAIRELKEETGLDVVKFIRPVTPFVFNSPGMTNEAISYAFVEVNGKIAEDIQDPEDISTYQYSRAAVAQLLEDAKNSRSNIFIGAKAWLIFERFVTYGDI
jgi:ADP-ribose pyrophosphatase